MGRAKVEMELISDTKKRGIMFQRRKESIIKKASELSTLCDVNVALIIYNDQHQIFPPDIDKFNNVIDLYQKSRRRDPGKIRSHDLCRKNNIEKAKKKNLEGKYPTWFGFLNDLTEGGLREFASELQGKIDKVKARIESIKKSSKIQNLETYPASTVIVLDDDDDGDVENPSPITNMISPNMVDYNNFGLFSGDQNPNVKNCDSMMSEEDYKNLGIDLDELFGEKDGLAISNVLMSEKEDNDNYWFDNGSFSLETDPLQDFCFSAEIMQPQQHQQPDFCFSPDIMQPQQHQQTDLCFSPEIMQPQQHQHQHPEFCFSPEIMQPQQHQQPEFCYEIMVQQQPESSSCCMEMKEFLMPSLPSHVMEYITGSGYH